MPPRQFCRRSGVVAGLAALLAVAVGSLAAAAPADRAVVEVRGVRVEFVLIPAGAFTMGSDENFGDGDESPQHRVTISQPFYLGKYEVTQRLWETVMGANPSRFRGPDLPVESVSWNDCQVFLAKFGELTGRKFALPSEAQWEYACRAGTTGRWSFGDTDAAVSDYAWCGADSGGQTHPVGTKKPNPWGLYDMHGNVGEWCADWYTKHAYAGGAATDPVGGRLADNAPVWRGGAWGDGSDYLRSAYRNCNAAEQGHHGIGLRCVMLVDVSVPDRSS